MKTITLATIIAAAVAAGVPTFFALVCYFGSWERTDCGWLGAIPTWALMGAIAGFVTGIWMVCDRPFDWGNRHTCGRIQFRRFKSCRLGWYSRLEADCPREYVINTSIFAMSLFVLDKDWK